MALKTAGYDGLILTGKAEQPSLIEIDDQVQIKSAELLWGKDTKETQDDLKLPKSAAALVIGPAEDRDLTLPDRGEDA